MGDAAAAAAATAADSAADTGAFSLDDGAANRAACLVSELLKRAARSSRRTD
jgi:hypothetical protein